MATYPGHDADGNPTVPLYKIVGTGGEPLHGGSGRWSLPCSHGPADMAPSGPGLCDRPDHRRMPDGTWAAPGEWWEIEGQLIPCRNALHLTDAEHLDTWLPAGPTGGGRGYIVFRAEVDMSAPDGEDAIYADRSKYAARRVRLLPRTRPMPDLAGAYNRKADALQVLAAPIAERKARATHRLNRAIDRAVKARAAAKVTPVMAAYAAAVGKAWTTAPPAMAAGIAAYEAIAAPAHAAYRKAIRDLDAEYAAGAASIDAEYVAGIADLLSEG